MEKIIHYCWFGKKPLPKMAKKCIKSWKKYYPDFEIKQWNETNFDINICPFVAEAYKQEKWAFVSDYVRLYALYNYGGIYFDTDMQVLSNKPSLLDNEIFLGYEENRIIAAGVIGVKKKNNMYIKELLDYYNLKEGFDISQIYQLTIPKIITNTWKKYPKETINSIEILDKNIYIYPQEYFYPINYLKTKKIFTNNTCMIHHYNATWVPLGERIYLFIIRTFGESLGSKIYKIYNKICNFKNKLINFLKQKIYTLKHFISIHFLINKRVLLFSSNLNKEKGHYIVISHPDWLGVKNVAFDNFEHNLTLREQFTEKEAKRIAKAIVASNKDLVVFNGFALGWNYIAKELKHLNKQITIKIIWHGSNALLIEDYDYDVFTQILTLYRNKIIDEIGFVKKSLYEFYLKKGYNVSFIMNDISIKNPEKYYKKNHDTSQIKIGLYASGDRWVKNTYNQLSAASLIENAVLDCIPINDKILELANFFSLEVTGCDKNVSREELFKRLSSNNVNLYVTFTECAPLLPLESLELGVPCITGDTHHYFEGTELEKYLIVSKEDNIIEIYNKIIYVLNNREKIINLYKEFREKYMKEAKESINKFLTIDKKVIK